MIDERSNEGRVVDERWHQFRERARKTAFSPEEFSAEERERFNLDDDDRLAPARVTGEENPDNYSGSDPVGIDPLEPAGLDDDPIR